MLVGYQRSAALATAIELDLFTHIGAGRDTELTLAKACGASTRGLRSLADALVVLGLLGKRDGRYTLGREAALFLDRRSPSCVGSMAEFLHNATLREAFGAHLTESVRRGTTAIGPEGTMEREHPAWVQFARGMAPLVAPQAEALAAMIAARGLAPARVLDVAAGHGLYGIALAKRFPRAEIALADWEGVLRVAVEHARHAGVEQRIELVRGDAREIDFGGPYELALVCNFLHHFPIAEGTSFLTDLRRHLRPGGALVVVEYAVEPDRVRPAMAALFSLVMLATTRGGDAFTHAELRELVGNAGFDSIEIAEIEGFGAHALFARAP